MSTNTAKKTPKKQSKTQKILPLLGKYPDTRIAYLCQVSPSLVWKVRTMKGIPAVAPTRNKTKEVIALLGKYTDTEIARRLKVSLSLVWKVRHQQNVPAVKRVAS